MNARQAWDYLQSGQGIGVKTNHRALECQQVEAHRVECDSPTSDAVLNLGQSEFVDLFQDYHFHAMEVQDMAG